MSHRDPHSHSYDDHDHYHDEPDHSDSNSAATDELDESEEDDECPLCMEPFDATDREFTPCKCGYKICLWCWHNLNNIYTSSTSSSTSASSLLSSSPADRPPLAGRCPACRQPYQYPEMTFNAAALQSSLTAKQQKKAHRDKHKRDKSNTHTVSSSAASATSSTSSAAASSASDAHSKSTSDNNTRVLQRNLMYVANLPASVAKEELLEDKRYFGKFGKIVKIAITRKGGGSGGGGGSSASGGSYSAYVTFKRAADCALALQLCHHTLLQGQIVKCMYGTTKYCPFWLRSVPCTMNRCGYLHALASAEDVVGKEELQAMEKKGDGEKPIPFPLQTTITEALAAAKAHKSVQPADETDLSSSSTSSSSSSSSSFSASAPTSSATTNPPASVWKLPVAPPISASSSATAASSFATGAASSTTSSSSSAAAAASSLRPYVSILAQSQNATQSPSSTGAASVLPSSSVTNEIIRIVPSYLKDKFTASNTPSSTSQQSNATTLSSSATAASSGRRKGGSTSSTATASPALSPVSTASGSSVTASPSMSRSTSKASSASSRASSPILSPLLTPADSITAALSHSPPPAAPHSARSVVSPLPPAALSPAASVTSIASYTSSTSEQPQHSQPVSAVPAAAEYQFDFVLYSQFDFSSFFSTYAANDPLFSWLCTPSHAAVHPFARARLPQQQPRSESRFDFARHTTEDEDKLHGDGGGDEAGVEGGIVGKQADSAWNEQKVDPAAAQGAAVIQQVGGRRTR